MWQILRGTRPHSTASRLIDQLIQQVGETIPIPGEADLTHRFPDTAILADASLGDIGLPQDLADMIGRTARAFEAGSLSWQMGGSLDETLTAWTERTGLPTDLLNHIAIWALGERDAFPAADPRLQASATRLEPTLNTAERVLERAEAWRPWRAYAAQLLMDTD